MQVRIEGVVVEGRYAYFTVRLPYWRLSVWRHPRSDPIGVVFLHAIDERIRMEFVEPKGVSEETMSDIVMQPAAYGRLETAE